MLYTMAEFILFALAIYIAFVVRATIYKLKKVDDNIEKLIAIEKAQKLINDELKKLK